MSDSDSELLETNRVFAFQNESTTVNARGPNINASNLTGISFRNNILTSTMNMPKNYVRQRRAESNYDQRSIGYRRETSPMSIASACDSRQRNFNRSIYPTGMSSQSSVYNGRGGSPMSIRSIDSNATLSSMDILTALKNNHYSEQERKLIKKVLNNIEKKKTRKRIEKRRNLKKFLKSTRRKSDSSELASNSSISSDDDRSTRTTNYKFNMSSCRSTKTDVADFRRTIKESNMFNDCTESFKQNRMQGMVANLNASRFSTKSMPPPQNFSKTYSTQQDRFKNRFELPSQRFNKSVAALSIPEAGEKPHHPARFIQNVKPSNTGRSESPQVANSDEEELFPDVTAIERPARNQRKRSVDSDDDDICLPFQKKPKVASPCKNMIQSIKNSTVIDKPKHDFEFAKPAFPVRKSANLKSKQIIHSKSAMNTTEKLICKSRGPLSDSILQPTSLPKQVNTISQSKEVAKELIEKDDSQELSTISQNTSDVSMRPSFIKRKLFTQNMDVTKTTDMLAANSPPNSVYGGILKERNKSRKLVTSQNCLKRDIQPENNNFLDLIHKIVPAETMNATNQTNKMTMQNNVTEDDVDDKWDVTSIISVRNNDENVSDTFTDEDTTVVDNETLQPSLKVSQKQPPPMLVTEKKQKYQNIQKVLVEKNGSSVKQIQKNVMTFWDTDCESDADRTSNLRKAKLKENQTTENVTHNVDSSVKHQGFSSMFTVNKTSTNNILNSIQKRNNTSKSIKAAIQKDKKARKDDILSDVINKSVPAKKTSPSNDTNKKAAQNKVSGDDGKCHKKPDTSIRNKDEVSSDTFTDEDSVLGNNGIPSPKMVHKQKTPPKLVTEKKVTDKITQKILVDQNGTPMKKLQKNVITFWDTDFESDAERTPIPRKADLKENKKTENTAQNVVSKAKLGGNVRIFSANKTSLINNTVHSVQKFNNTNKSFRICSHINNKPIAKMTAQEKVKTGAKPCFEPQSKNQKTIKASSCLDQPDKKNTDKNKEAKPKEGNKKPSPKKLKINKNTPNKTKEKEPPMEQTSKCGRILRTPKRLEETVQSKSLKTKEPSENSIVVNKPQKKSNGVQNKNEIKTPKTNTTTKQQSIKTSDTAIKKQSNKRVKSLKGGSTQNDTTVDSNKSRRIAKITLSRVPDYTFFKKTLTETNNNKVTPVRSCRISKQTNMNRTIRPVRSCRYSGQNDSLYSRFF